MKRLSDKGDARVVKIKRVQRQSAGLVDLEAFELPVSIVEARRVVPHKGLAGAGAAALSRVEFIRASPVTAQIDICDDALVFEMRTDVAICVGEICKRCAPSGWVGASRGDIRWDF